MIIFLVFFVGFIFAIAIFSRRWKRSEKMLPPGSFGWPVIGETIALITQKHESFIMHRMKRYSPDIFKTNIAGMKTAVICGPKGNKLVFTNEQKLFTAYRPDSMKRIFQSEDKYASQIAREEESKILRSPGFLKQEALVGYLEMMDIITQQQMAEFWEGKQEVKVFELAKILTLSLACRFFLGIREPERIAKLLSFFDDITRGLHSVPIDLPGTNLSKAKNAAAVIRKELMNVIKEKKATIASGAHTQDVLSFMMLATDCAGRHTPEAEIGGNIMGLLVAGYSTVATTITFFMKFIGERPDIYAKVLDEQRRVSEAKMKGDFLTWGDFQKMKYSWNVILEVIRLVPPLQGTFRVALADFSYGGYTIPKGWKVYWTVSTTNKSPEFFPEPEKFDPSRFEENKPLPPYVFVPFGGGPRTCPGKEYSRLAILTFIHNVVKRFQWEVVHPDEEIVGDMMPVPAKGLPIRLKPN